MEKTIEMTGIEAMQWAREISKIPQGDFTICFFPYSRIQGMAGEKMIVKEHCKWRTQLPQDCFKVDAENFFLFEDQRETQRCVIASSSDTWDSHRMDINYIKSIGYDR